MMILTQTLKMPTTVMPTTVKRWLGKKLMVICLLPMALAGLPAHADSQINAATEVITKMIGEVEAYLATDSGDVAKRTQNIAQLFDTHFDLEGIARFSAGPYWRAATDQERITYIQTMRDVMVGTVVRNFDQLSGLNFTTIDSQAKGEKMVLVRGTFNDATGKRPPVSVGWRVITPSAAPAKVLDVEIENISMLVTQKQENIAIIRKNEGRFSALIEAMKERRQSR
jgi:phospholipid transport system substrate-binding protein